MRLTGPFIRPWRNKVYSNRGFIWICGATFWGCLALIIYARTKLCYWEQKSLWMMVSVDFGILFSLYFSEYKIHLILFEGFCKIWSDWLIFFGIMTNVNWPAFSFFFCLYFLFLNLELSRQKCTNKRCREILSLYDPQIGFKMKVSKLYFLFSSNWVKKA